MRDWTEHLRSRLSSLRLPPAREAEIVEELSQHLDDRWRELIAAGASPDEATRLALADFREGNLLAQYMAPLRQAHPSGSITPGAPSGHWLSGSGKICGSRCANCGKTGDSRRCQSPRWDWESARPRRFFSLIYNVLLAPFPEKEVERMVFPRIHNVQQSQAGGRQGYTATEILEFAENSRSLDEIIAASGEVVLYKHGDGTEQFQGALVTPGTFEFFGMPALHGRAMQPSDYEPGVPPVFVMRHKTWMARFNGDLSLLN